MARSRFDSLDPQRREAILAAAADEFAGRGYAGASLTRVSERAGIGRGSLYYYFNDKQDLFVTTIQESMKRLVDRMGGFNIDALSAETYWNTLRDLALRSVGLMTQDEWYARLAMAFPRLRDEPAAQNAVRPALDWGRQLTAAVLSRGQQLGTVRRDLPLDLLVAVTVAADDAGNRWVARHQPELDEDRLRSLVEARVDLMRDMLDAEHEGWDR